MKLENIQTQTMTLNDLFYRDRRFRIPGYQRPYEWAEREIESLLNHLTDAYESKKTEIYLVGTLQFNQVDVDTYEIIDGHQRLTTFYLLLRCLGIQPHLQYRNEISGETSLEPLIHREGSRYQANDQYIRRYLAERAGEASWSSEDFCQYLRNNIVFVAIILQNCTSIADTLQIFSTLNTTGLSLDIKDIFKIRFHDYWRSAGGGEQTAFFSRINGAYEKVTHPHSDQLSQAHPANTIYRRRESDLLDTYRFFLISQTKNQSYANQLKSSNNEFFDRYFKNAPPDADAQLDTFCQIAECMQQTQRLLFERDQRAVDKFEVISCCSRELIQECGYGKLKNLYDYLIYRQYRDSPSHTVTEEMLQTADQIMTCVWKYCSVYRLLYAKVINATFIQVGQVVFQPDVHQIRDTAPQQFLDELKDSGRNLSAYSILSTSLDHVLGCNKPHLLIMLSYIDDVELCPGKTIYDVKKDLFYRPKWDLNIEHILSRSLYEEESVQSIGNLMYLKDNTNKGLGVKTKKLLQDRLSDVERKQRDFHNKLQNYPGDRGELMCVDAFLKTYHSPDFLEQRTAQKREFLQSVYALSRLVDN